MNTYNIQVTENQNKRNLGRFIATQRKLLDMTQLQLSEKSGLDNSYISRVEKGQIEKPRRDNLEKLEAALSLSKNTLVNWAFAKKNKSGFIEDNSMVADLDNKSLPPYLEAIARKKREEAAMEEDGGSQDIDALIEQVLIGYFKELLREGDFIRKCRKIFEKELRNELSAKMKLAK